MTTTGVTSVQFKRAFLVFGLAVAAIGSAACGSGSSDKSTPAAATADPHRRFDLQAHRGGRGMTIEESLPGFAKAIELGVSTLELDIVLTKDNVPLIWHDPTVQAEKCADTAPAFPDDPQYPYVGKVIHDLTDDQVHTLDCGKKLAGFPEAQELPGNKIARLPELFDLVKTYPGAFDTLRYNVETKLEAEHPEQSATPEEFVRVILDTVATAAATDKVEIQSFDWRSLPLVKAKNPAIPTVALYDDSTFEPNSKWLGPVRYEDHVGDPLGAIKALGANISSPDYKTVGSPAEYVRKAHDLDLTVVPWTVNEKSDIAAVLDGGFDGIITDYPNRAREVMRDKGYPLPMSFHK
ncbi:glycerophosphodiester phosphodiesterase [Nocardia sp. CDC153]|uniref:glycerophosphodiester phosphodiesterase n=1 Tax=Nocardia sp. CDC153 TaxID=3112167 RepID=UPI002DBA4390|nr:glycerophosphodiester phosphodiesterase [Nocardia sp. CDC153]MEC3952272.1 glycerophosphodiester phosphodiesterase [Nocardia sp. CDC153]